jgi:hypothetical protein
MERKIPVPCGKCPACLKRRANGWAFRLKEHHKITTSAYFLTLTYDNEHVPISVKNFLTLNKKHFQDFLKRLRKHHTLQNIDTKICYYAVGEYGTNTYRPHYHAIIYNINPDLLQKAWTLGQIHVGEVNGATISYVCKYLHKGKTIPMHQNDDRVPEFSLMSKKLGLNYLTPQMLKYHRDDISRNYVTLEGGVKSAMPRYYREKIYDEKQRYKQSLLIVENQHKKQIKDVIDYTNNGNPIENYDYDRFQSIKYCFETFNQKSKQSRQKL